MLTVVFVLPVVNAYACCVFITSKATAIQFCDELANKAAHNA